MISIQYIWIFSVNKSSCEWNHTFDESCQISLSSPPLMHTTHTLMWVGLAKLWRCHSWTEERRKGAAKNAQVPLMLMFATCTDTDTPKYTRRHTHTHHSSELWMASSSYNICFYEAFIKALKLCRTVNQFFIV